MISFSHVHLLVQLFEKFRPSSVLVLTSLPSYNHFTHHAPELSPQSCFLRTITTSSWPHPLSEGAVPLEPPNTLSGEPAAGMVSPLPSEILTLLVITVCEYCVCSAAVLTFCQVHNIPASVTALYTMASESMSEQVAGLSSLLDHPLLVPLTRRVGSL